MASVRCSVQELEKDKQTNRQTPGFNIIEILLNYFLEERETLLSGIIVFFESGRRGKGAIVVVVDFLHASVAADRW